MPDPATKERFKRLVRRIDAPSKAGDHRQALTMLSELLAVEPGDPSLVKKTSHFIAALAFRALQGGDPAAALHFLDIADEQLPDEHMTPFLREEREALRRAATGAPSPT